MGNDPSVSSSTETFYILKTNKFYVFLKLVGCPLFGKLPNVDKPFNRYKRLTGYIEGRGVISAIKDELPGHREQFQPPILVMTVGHPIA